MDSLVLSQNCGGVIPTHAHLDSAASAIKSTITLRIAESPERSESAVSPSLFSVGGFLRRDILPQLGWIRSFPHTKYHTDVLSRISYSQPCSTVMHWSTLTVEVVATYSVIIAGPKLGWWWSLYSLCSVWQFGTILLYLWRFVKGRKSLAWTAEEEA